MHSEFSLTSGICIGSIKGNAKVKFYKCAIKTFVGGSSIACIGTLDGDQAQIDFESTGLSVNSRGDRSTCLGALKGHTDLSLSYTGVRGEGHGKDAMIVGSVSGDTSVKMSNSDMLVKIKTEVDEDVVTCKEHLDLEVARCKYTINDEVVDIKEV